LTLSSGANPGRREAAASGRSRKADTQARILEAAVTLFTARGYEGTSISAVAARAHVSRSAVFWHFGDKENLFREAFRRLLVPFAEEIKASLQHLDARKRLVELFDVYESFVAEHRDTIQSIVRWVLESRSLRASLEKPLFAMHDEFARDVRGACEEILDDPNEAAAVAAGILSLLHGNLLLSFLDPDPSGRELRRAGLRRVTERTLQGRRGD
jgi:AcrR family transcriptional regulator